jgi:hypothetical protein
MKTIYCDRLCGWDVTGRRILGTTTQTVTIYSPHPISLLRHWATIQEAHAELPGDGAHEVPKHVGVN